MRLGTIEAGGTKIICGIGDENGQLGKKATIPTLHPRDTIPEILGFFASNKVEALGIGTFGPVEIDPASPQYGMITSTPKEGWRNFDLLGALKAQIDVPMVLDTDVNAAVLAESRWGAAKGLDNSVYITVGTGIGAGILAQGRLVHGLLHPEVGHMLIRRHPDDSFVGNCPYHHDCAEGMAAGPAIAKRWGKPGIELTHEEAVWDLEAFYLAQVIANLLLILSTQKVILGGGVMGQKTLFPKIRHEVIRLLNGYIDKKAITENIHDLIVAPGLGSDAGLKGGLALIVNHRAGK